jgi:hypothetical protein
VRPAWTRGRSSRTARRHQFLDQPRAKSARAFVYADGEVQGRSVRGSATCQCRARHVEQIAVFDSAFPDGRASGFGVESRSPASGRLRVSP